MNFSRFVGPNEVVMATSTASLPRAIIAAGQPRHAARTARRQDAGAAGAGRDGAERMNRDEILKTADEERVRFMRLQFTDILGVIKNVEIPRSQFEKALDGQIMFDGSSIQGFTRIEESDMLLTPDYETFRINPWALSIRNFLVTAPARCFASAASAGAFL